MESNSLIRVLETVIGELGNKKDKVKVSQDEDTSVLTSKFDLLTLCYHVLHWMVRREIETEKSIRQPISVSWAVTGPEVTLTFEDTSRRLSELRRGRLFQPFSIVVPTSVTADGAPYPSMLLPLYLAKAIAVGYGGTLEDRTGDRPDAIGHRLVLTLPRG